ncbi:aryl-sulfate sulfotransferase, partial [Burkholderia pseudomallei]|uniref:aryl-sulfate sulfotransferase n=2 Tax=Pseudomonadota TaxID=1224 RepID=UPI003CE92DA3
QPALPTMKYSRFVEYKVDEKKGTVQQIWEYGKERSYDFYSPITSVIEYQKDRDTMVRKRDLSIYTNSLKAGICFHRGIL